MMQATGIQAYDDPQRAALYHQRTGFDPARKGRMLDVALQVWIDSLALNEGAQN